MGTPWFTYVVVWEYDEAKNTQTAIKAEFVSDQEAEQLEKEYPYPRYGVDVLNSSDRDDWGIQVGRVEEMGFDPYISNDAFD